MDIAVTAESVDLGVLSRVPFEERAKLPTIGGVYFAIDGAGIVQYIGQAENIRKRWRYHHKGIDLVVLKGVEIAYLETNAELLEGLEKELIKRFQPKLNRVVKEPRAKKPRGGQVGNASARQAKEAWSKGLGMSHTQKPIAVRFPPAVESLLRAMSDRQDYIRAAVERQLQDDGLLEKREEK